jgi:peptidoglycan/LPS O-acetylase OafA/YrhL
MTISKLATLDPGVSSYLDGLRIIAAMTVLLNHYLPPLFGVGVDVVPGHDAVIIFFVMPGYVITFVTGDRDRPAIRYGIHRLARLWSVLIPSLCLSLVAAVLLGNNLIDVAPAISSPFAFMSASLRTALFLGENWFSQTPAPYNAPVWSLSYEAWYYAVFAAFSFAPGAWLVCSRARLSLRPGRYVLTAANDGASALSAGPAPIDPVPI